MTERQHAQRTRREDGTAHDEAQGADLRDSDLDEAVECCLAEIDAVLDDVQAERERAEAEYGEIVRLFREKNGEAQERYSNSVTDEAAEAAWRDACTVEAEAEDALRMLQAKYAHLGVQTDMCCGEPNFYMPDGEQ